MRTHTDRDLRMLLARRHGAPVDLSNACLEMANLSHADLRDASLAGANLRGVMLWGALLDGACLDGADLTCANLTWASLCRCSMNGALLVEADLEETFVDDCLSDAITVGADMVTVTFAVSATAPPLLARRARRTRRTEDDEDARDAAIWTAHEETASPQLRARGAGGFSRKHEELERAQIRVLSDTDLQDLLRWSDSTGNPLNLRGCNLSEANLRNASLRGACLAFTDAIGADTRGVDLTGANLQDSCGWPKPQRRPREVGPISGLNVAETSPVRPWWKLW
jgi:uncharacterized protein YjbI with pentapeptide repeats